MIKLLCGICLITWSTLIQSFDIHEFCQRNKPFQDILINNQVVCLSERSTYCSERYDVIRSIVNNSCTHSNRIRVLDVGAAQGYFSFRLAHDFDAHITMLENGDSAIEGDGNALMLLAYLCKRDDKAKNYRILTAPISHENLATLMRFERFDIVVALNIVHFFKNWRQIIDDLCALGSFVIIEIPSTEGDLSDFDGVALEMINKYLMGQGGKLIACISRMRYGQVGNVYLMQNAQNCVQYTQDAEAYTVMGLLHGIWPETMASCYTQTSNWRWSP